MSQISGTATVNEIRKTFLTVVLQIRTQKVKNLSKNVLFYQNMSYLSESETDIVPETRLLDLMRTLYFAKNPKPTFLLLPYSSISNLIHILGKIF